MHQEGETRVIEVYIPATSIAFESVVVDFGSESKAVKLLGVHYSCDNIIMHVDAYLCMALSSNPTHELNPPFDVASFHSDPSLYGRWNYQNRQLVTNENTEVFVQQLKTETAVIPLYGLIRPRRQILCYYWGQSVYLNRLVAEIFYKPVMLDRESLASLDRKYGKYRRT